MFSNTLINKVIKSAQTEKNTQFNEEKAYISLFNKNDYTQLLKMNKVKNLSRFNKINLFKELSKREEKQFQEFNAYCSNIMVCVEKDLSAKILSDNSRAITFDKLQNIPFKCFVVDLEHIQGVESALVYKTDDTLSIHLHNVGEEKISVQFIMAADCTVNLRRTLLSNFYISTMGNISYNTEELAVICFGYLISLIEYMINFKKDKRIIIKNMHNFNQNTLPQTRNTTNKQKSQNKKNDVIPFGGNSTQYKYPNKNSSSRKNRDIEAPFSVSGFYRHQPVGPRGSGQYKRTWINTFIKCKSDDTLEKLSKRTYRVK